MNTEPEREYRLSAEDALCAASVAMLQIIRKVNGGRNSDHGGVSKRTMRLRIADGIHGAMAELALAHMLGLNWTHGGLHITRGDVGGYIEVRATEYVNGHLLVYPSDRDASVLALMIGNYPCFRLIGFHNVGVVKQQPALWRADADPPCWFVPRASLLSLEHALWLASPA